MKNLASTLLVILSLVISPNLFAQNVSVNADGSLADTSAMLDVSSTTKGFLLPRMTTAQQNSIILPAKGLSIFNTTLNSIMVNTGTPLSPVWSGVAAGAIDTSSIANFSVKIRSLFSGSAPITYSNGLIGITQATTSTDGYLSSTDWNTFNNKQPAGSYLTANQTITLSGDVTGSGTTAITANVGKINGTSLSSLGTGILKNTTGTGIPSIAIASDFPTLNQNTTGSAAKFTTARTISITGDLAYTSPAFNGTANVTAVGTLATVNANVGSFTNANITVNGKGLITAASNGTAGTVTNIATGYGLSGGPITSTGTIIVDSATLHLKFLALKDSVNSITGYTTLYQNSLKQNQLNGTGFVKATGTTISYDNSTYLTSIDTSNISNFSIKVRSLFSSTAPITYSNGLIGITQAGTSTDGYLSSTDWNTFNNKQPAGSYLTANQTITLSGDVTGSGTTAITTNVGKINGTSLASLTTGILKNTTGTGVPSIAIATDFPTLNQNTTGSAAKLTTARTIAITGDLTYTSPAFDGSANVTAAGTLATVNANIGSFTNANITVNGKGLITAASNGTAGTVTNIATGYGLSGGPITSTGTIIVDSATLHLKFLALKDSVNSITGYTTLYQNSLKQNQLNGTGFVKATGTTISYDNSTYLTSIDTSNISNFSIKVRSLFSSTAPITYSNGLIGITQAGTSTDGYLSSTDWNTFNNKQPAGSYLTANQTITLSGDVTGSGTTAITTNVGKINGTSLASLTTGILKNTTVTGVPSIAIATDFPTLNQNTTGSAATLTTGRTIGITGDLTYTSPAFNGSSNVTAAGTLATVNANIGSFTNANITVNGKGLITAASNGTAGTVTNIATGYGLSGGPITSTGTIIVDSATLHLKFLALKDSVNSITGYTTLYQNSLKQNQLNGTGFVKATGTTISYDNSTYLTSIDTSNISNFSIKVRSLFSSTAPITYSNGLIGITQAGTSTDGYLSSTDWNTFNNKQPAGSYLTANQTITLSGDVTGSGTTAITTNVGKINGTSLASLTTGILKNTTGTGVPSIAIATDFPTLNQNTTGSAAKLTTARTIAITGDLTYTSPAFDGSANVTAAGTLATVNANIGSFTNANITVNGKGLITAASNGTAGTVTNIATGYGLSGGPITSTGTLLLDSATLFTTALRRKDSTLYTTVYQNSLKQNQLNGTGFVKATGTTISYDNSTYLTSNQTISFAPTGDVTGSITGTTTIAPALVIGTNKVLNTMLAQMPTLTIKGNNTGGTANAQDLTVAQVNAILPVFTATLNGLVPFSGGSAGKVLHGDGTWKDTASAANSWSITGNSGTSYLANFLGTTDNKSLRFRTNNAQGMILDSLQNVAIAASPSFSATNPEKLLVDAGTGSYNVISGKGNLNNFLQLNIKNSNSGTTASSDVVATNDAGTEANGINYVDMGINSSGYSSSGVLGGANNAYLYATGNDFIIGNSTASMALRFFTTNASATSSEAMRIDPNGNLGIGTTAPTTALNVVKSNSGGGLLTMQNSSASGYSSADFLNSSAALSGTFGYANASVSAGIFAGRDYFNSYGNDFLWTANSASAAIFVKGSNSNVGIGTTAPASALHVYGTNPLTLTGVQLGTTTTADSLLTINSGTVQKLPVSTFLTAGNSWSTTGNTGTTSATDFIGTTDNKSFKIKTNNSEGFLLDSLGNVGIGSTPAFTVSPNREKLLVDAGSLSNPNTSYNVISGKGYIDNYLQLNIQNRAGTASASSDIVASNDAATEAINYIDMGVNSSGNTSSGVLGGVNTGYLYSTGSDFAIGNATSGKSLLFFTGGTTSGNEQMRITSGGNVGIGTTTPNSTFQGTGSFSLGISTETVTYTATNSDHTILCNNTAAMTVNLPTAVGITGRIYVIKKISTTSSPTHDVTIDGNGSETIDGALTKVLNTQWTQVTVQSNNVDWFIIGN